MFVVFVTAKVGSITDNSNTSTYIFFCDPLGLHLVVILTDKLKGLSTGIEPVWCSFDITNTPNTYFFPCFYGFICGFKSWAVNSFRVNISSYLHTLGSGWCITSNHVLTPCVSPLIPTDISILYFSSRACSSLINSLRLSMTCRVV